MRRTPIAHVIFPRFDVVRPVPEFAWEAARSLLETDDLDVEVVMPVPARFLRRAQDLFRSFRGATTWPPELEARLQSLDPRPTLVPFVPVPGRSIEAATAAMAAHMIARPRAGRPRSIQGSFLDEGGYAAAMIGRVVGCPAIVAAHGTDVRAARGHLSGSAKQHRRQQRALQALQYADRVVAVCHHLAQELAILGARADVLPFTARASRFVPLGNLVKEGDAQAATHGTDGTDETEILFVGRVSREKGVDALLKAFAQTAVRRRGRGAARLRLVGPPAEGFDVLSLAQALGVANEVIVEGEVPQDRLPPFYANASCLVLPSRAEGLPCVVAEALLMGRPVVASDVGGMRELVDDRVGRLVASVDDPERLAVAIDEVVMAAKAGAFDPAALRERAMPTTWEHSGPKLAALTRETHARARSS
ncbi:MAG: glycosyltransferase [Deltaproteobacteria bacterium]|nr:glycosyltransferase [Deltaproteobacteria bacterium]